MTIRTVFVIVVSVLIFSGVSLLYQAPALFYAYVFQKDVTPTVTTKYAFTAGDSGMTVTYPIGKEFTIILDKNTYPDTDWEISCSASNVLEKMTSVKALIPPLYAYWYSGVSKGICILKNNDFFMNVRIIDVSS